ncbi:MAG TPA: hypothetical protein IGS31_04995 [Oscillatoriales cyanobacterium M4454_W2019_049]|nr:hypothetical protein [Oscillatoriales cyanobacterium M4454_W2019_049]
MLRRIFSFCLCLTFCWTTTACGSSASNYSGSGSANSTVAVAPNQVTSGEYPVQQAQYNDADGLYTLMLLNTPAGVSPTFQTTDLQMAQLTPEEVQAGKRSYLSVDGGQAILHLTEDFRIEYVHNVVEQQTDPQTGQTQTVIVRQESSFWTPFAGALAGQIVGNMLFSPRYYVPPVYQPGVVMTGYGGYGSSYSQAVQSYQSRYNAPPAAVKNRQTLRTTGNLRSPSTSSSTQRKPQGNSTRSTGSGYGSSNLRTGSKSKPTYQKRSTGFGSGGRSARPSRSRRR